MRSPRRESGHDGLIVHDPSTSAASSRDDPEIGASELEPSATDQIPGRAWLVLAVCSSVVVLTLLDSGMLFVAFPFIEERFAADASRTTLSWAVTVFFVTMVSALLVAGRVADRYGRRRVFLSGLLVFGIAALVAAVTANVWLLIAMRGLQGLGVSLLSPSALAMALPEFPMTRRAYALGVWGTIGAIAGLVASPLAAAIVELFGWRGIFVFNGALALVVGAVGVVVLADQPVPPRTTAEIDLIGSALTMAAVGGLALVLVQGSDWGWTDPATLAAATVAIVGGTVFVRRNARHRAPLIDTAIFTNRRFVTASIASVCCQLGFFSTYFGVPLYMSEVWDWSPLRIGLALLPLNVVPVLTAIPAGRIVDRRGPRGMIAFGGVFAAAWYLAMGLWLTDAGYLWLAVGLAFSSLGAMAIGNSTTVAALYDIDDADLGAANAGYFVTRRLGSALGAVVVAAIVGNRAGANFADVYLWVWVFGAAAYLVGGLTVWRYYPPLSSMATARS